MTRMTLLAAAVLLAAGLGTETVSAQKKAKKNAQAPKKVRIQRGVLQRQIQIFPGRGFRGVQNPFGLLRNPKVQEDLKLDEDQKTEITDAQKELNKSRREEFQKLRALKGQERQKKNRELRKKFAADSNKKVQEILEPKQHARLQQILVQAQGIRALQNPEIQKKLKVTDEQKEKFTEIQKSSRQERAKAVKDLRANGGRIDIKKFREMNEKLAKAQEKKTLEALTKEQAEQFAKMKGKKIDLGRRGGLLRPGIGIRPIRVRPIRGKKIKGKKIRGRRIKRKAIKRKKADDK